MTYCSPRLWIPLSPMLAAALAAGCDPASEPRQAVAMTLPAMQGDRRDFDFLAGTWDVRNRRLVAPHVGSTVWEEFPGRATVRHVLDGLGNVDEIDFPTRGWSQATLRFFNPDTRQWSIHWVDSRNGIVQPPAVGSFRGGAGDFFGDDIDDGRPVRVRLRWTRVAADAARFERAFSIDGERTWETNWVMDLRRAAPPASERRMTAL